MKVELNLTPMNLSSLSLSFLIYIKEEGPDGLEDLSSIPVL